MIAYSKGKLPHYLVSAALIMTITGACFVPSALAKVIGNTINATAHVSNHGRHLVATGPITGNIAGELAYVRVTVTQRTTGAVAEGQTFLTLTGAAQQWEIHLSTRGNETFEEGPALAVAIATSSARGVTTDAHQWLVPITLVKP